MAVDRRDNSLVVAPRGELDIATVGEVRGAVDASAGTQHLVLDLSGVTFIDTSGMSLVLELQQRTTAAGRRFTVVQGTEEVRRLFEISGLEPRLPSAATVQAALDDGVDAG